MEYQPDLTDLALSYASDLEFPRTINQALRIATMGTEAMTSQATVPKGYMLLSVVQADTPASSSASRKTTMLSSDHPIGALFFGHIFFTAAIDLEEKE